MGLISNLDAFR